MGLEKDSRGNFCRFQKLFFWLASIFLLFLVSACATGGGSEVSMEEAKSLALEFQSRHKEPPPRGIDKDLQRLMDRHPEHRAASVSTGSVPGEKYTYEYVAELGAGIAGLSPNGAGPQMRVMAWSEFLNGNINNALVITQYVDNMDHFRYSGTVGSCLAQKAVFLAELGDFQGARYSLQRGRQLINASSQWYIYSYYETLAAGMVAYAQGDMAAAEILFYKALKVYDKVSRTDFGMGNLNAYGHKTYLLLCIARTMLEMGRMPEAELWIREALESYTGYYFLLPHCLTILSDIYMAQNRYEDANAISKTALNAVLRKVMYTDAFIRARARDSLARTYLALGDWQQALVQYELIAKEMSTDPDAYENWFRYSTDRGVAQLMNGNPRAALEQFDRALVKKQRSFGTDHYVVLEIEVLRAMALAADGQTETALKLFRETVPELIMKWKEQRFQSGRVFTSRYKVELFIEAYLNLLEESGQTSELEKALAYAGILHGDSVGKALSSSVVRTSVKDPELAELIRQRQDLGLQLATVQGRINALLRQSNQERYKESLEILRAEIMQLRGAITTLDEEVNKQFPRYGAIVNPPAMSVQEIRELLKEDEAYIFIFPCPTRTFVWAFGPDGPVAFKKIEIDRGSLAETITRLRQALDPENVGQVGDIPEFDVDLAYELYQKILQPVENGWTSARSLLVVTASPLGQIPLSILPTRPPRYTANRELLFAGYRDVPWLARSHGITMLPSATTLAALRSLPEPGNEKLTFIGFGDPWFQPLGKSSASAPGNTDPTRVASRGGQVHLRGVRISEQGGLDEKNLASIQLSQLIRLPETADEILSMARAVGADERRDVFLGPQASETNVKSLDLQDRRIIVFATHGLIPGDLNGLEQPALALSSPQVTKGEEDGLLTMSEIMGLHLNADWVVLSACNTGAGEGSGAEAVSGLGQAFFYAGTRALLVTNWPVETSSAKLLTTSVFRLQSQNPELERAEALRGAMLALMDDSAGDMFAYAHPIFWAPFIMVGE